MFVSVDEITALLLYPLWATSVVVGVTTLRLGQRERRGLIALCFALAGWVTGLVLLQHPATAALAERVMPLGMLTAGAFVHASADLTGRPDQRWVRATWAASAGVALVGAVFPGVYYAPGLASVGPLFWPVAVVGGGTAAVLIVWLFRARAQAPAAARRRITALLVGTVGAGLGGGGSVGLHAYGVADLRAAAVFLLPAVGLTAYAVLGGEAGPARRLVVQGLVYAGLTALLSSVGLVLFFFLLPYLAPGGAEAVGWLVFVTFCAALPLDALRMLLVETLGRRLFTRPTGVRDLAERAERSEVRADHAETLAEVGAMASAVAHEIRNPLGVIAAQAKLLERAGADPRSVAALRAQVDRARSFLDDLLRYSKPRPLKVVEVDLKAALEAALDEARQLLGSSAAEEGGPTLVLDCAEDLSLEADAAALHDILVVLLHNAVAAQEGAPGHVWLRAAREGGALRVLVEDDGPGVPEAVAGRLFEPFVTGRGRDHRHPGTGLGLAIARRWAERHGASLQHRPRRGGGACFVLAWPPG